MTDSSEKLPQCRSVALVALGSNVASTTATPLKVVQSAVELIAESCGVIRSVSTFYETPAYPLGSGPDFVNAALVLETSMSADALLSALHRIEAALGRQRKQRWAPRTLDLDLLAIGDMLRPDRAEVERWLALPVDQQQQRAPDVLILPHPRLHERAFVLVPLADAMKEAGLEWKHPILEMTVDEMLAALPAADISGVKPLSVP